MSLHVLYTGDLGPTVARQLRDSHIATRQVVSASDLHVAQGPSAFVLGVAAAGHFTERTLRGFIDQGGTVVAVGPQDRDAPEKLSTSIVSAYVPDGKPRQLLIAIRGALREAAARAEALRLRHETSRRAGELAELTQIGMALNTERDYDALLNLILSHARRITGSDAGSLYLVEQRDGDAPRLLFKLAQNGSRPSLAFDEFTIPLDSASIAGHVALTAEPLIIDDAYDIAEDASYTFNRSVDESISYRTKSLLTVPMIDHNDDVIGILQLVNRKRVFDAVLNAPEDVEALVVPFSGRTERLVSALAGQAAVSIDNRQLIKGIEDLFENFVAAAVLAIEQRDLPTQGHSRRVAAMTVAFAETVDGIAHGSYKDLRFTLDQIKEIRYAGLLHDFGKVGVREQVLGKAKKLYASDLESLQQRHGFLLRSAERDFYRQQTEYLLEHGSADFDAFLARLEATYRRSVEELDRFRHLVDRSNEPTVLPDGNFDELQQYATMEYLDIEGARRPYLTADELRFLTIRRGSLDEEERRQIQDHVDHTYQFLKRIPWTGELSRIPEIARGHHEKLDGSGYPRQIQGDAILPQTRMMTIADIFDALAAQDRPYKERLEPARALDILHQEVRQGALDAELFELFTEAEIYRLAEPTE